LDQSEEFRLNGGKQSFEFLFYQVFGFDIPKILNKSVDERNFLKLLFLRMSSSLLYVIGGYVLDLIFGDPNWFPHPVKAIGWLIKRLESLIYSKSRWKGVVFTIIIVSISWGITFFIIKFSFSINTYLGGGVSLFLIYTCLATKDLKAKSLQVYTSLFQKNLSEARKNLSLIVGRDTQNLSRQEIIRATIETIAENTVDGIVSPLFYAFIGGAPLAMAYKAINTLDSMVGYKDERYKEFGWFSAKLDDIANWVPARLTKFLIFLSTFILRMNPMSSWRTIVKYSKNSPSPNAGIPEAGFAGAIGVQLGGVNYYRNRKFVKPIIGEINKIKEERDILKAITLMYGVSIISFLFGIGTTLLVSYFKSLLS
jgi:adenosylcobinamide-phosphate synthase